MMNNIDFYKAFEERYRGSRELIKKRLQVYLPFVMHFLEIYDDCRIIDLGCGRGEWLELMLEQGFKITGVDLDDGMLEVCAENNLPAEKKDAIFALRELQPASQSVVSGFHIAEHLPFGKLQEVMEESFRVLKPGGLLILETPNPENIKVATIDFYLDPTHKHPLPPELLFFLSGYHGFERAKILRLQESSNVCESEKISLLDFIGAVSPDYALIAQKKAPTEVISIFDPEFNRDYGLTIETIETLYESIISGKFSALDEKISRTEYQLKTDTSILVKKLGTDTSILVETEIAKAVKKLEKDTSDRLYDLELHTQQLEEAFNAIHNSRSWKITAPCRVAGDFVRSVLQAFKNLLKPGLEKVILFIMGRPILKKGSMSILRFMPGIETRLSRFYYSKNIKNKYTGKERIRSEFSTSDPKLKSSGPELSENSKGLSIDEILKRIRTELVSKNKEIK